MVSVFFPISLQLETGNGKVFSKFFQKFIRFGEHSLLKVVKKGYLMVGGLVDYKHGQLLHAYRELVPTIQQQKP